MALSLNDLKKSKPGSVRSNNFTSTNKKTIAKPWQDAISNPEGGTKNGANNSGEYELPPEIKQAETSAETSILEIHGKDNGGESAILHVSGVIQPLDSRENSVKPSCLSVGINEDQPDLKTLSRHLSRCQPFDSREEGVRSMDEVQPELDRQIAQVNALNPFDMAEGVSQQLDSREIGVRSRSNLELDGDTEVVQVDRSLSFSHKTSVRQPLENLNQGIKTATESLVVAESKQEKVITLPSLSLHSAVIQPLDSRELDVRITHSNLDLSQTSGYQNDAMSFTPESRINQPLDECESGVSQPLDTRSKAVSQPLNNKERKPKKDVKPLESHHAAVSSALVGTLDRPKVAKTSPDDSVLDIALITGKEKEIVRLACDECRKIASLETNYISNDELQSKISIDLNGLRNLIFRVKNKGYFEVQTRQLGHVGLRKFIVPPQVYSQFSAQTLVQRESAVRSVSLAPLEAALETPPSSSSILNKKDTTTNVNKFEKYEDLPEEWTLIDLLGADIIPLNKNDLLKVVNSYKAGSDLLELAKTAQASIEAMINDLRTGHAKRHKSPRAVLFRNLLDGTAYGSLDSAYVPEWLQEKRRSLEVLKRYQKEAQEIEKEKTELANRTFLESSEQKQVFTEWKKSKSELEIKTICKGLDPFKASGQAMMRDAFQKEQELINQQANESLGMK